MSMEKLLGKVVHTTGFSQFVTDFLEWAGSNTASARLVLPDKDIEIEILTERNAESPRLSARGLQGGGDAVAAWAESEGWLVVAEEPDMVSIETDHREFPDTSQTVAAFLSPSGNWTIEEISARRKPS